LIGEVYVPFNIGTKLDSLGIERGSNIKLECMAPEKMCKDFVMQLYEKGYGVSKEEGMYDVVLGPLKNFAEDSFVLYYRVANQEDSVIFKMENQDFEFKRENSSKKGILSALLFIFTGYLLFFVIR